MLSNAYFVAKFRFDTAENEPAKNLQKFSKNAFFENAFSKNPAEVRGVDLRREPRDGGSSPTWAVNYE